MRCPRSSGRQAWGCPPTVESKKQLSGSPILWFVFSRSSLALAHPEPVVDWLRGVGVAMLERAGQYAY